MDYNVKKGRQSASHPARQFRTFEDLEVYTAAREFRKKMYGVTRQLPGFEKFELASQIRRAAVSLTNNIADQARFILGARGSLQELVDDLNVCADEKYLPGSEIDERKKEGWKVLGLINGYLRYLRDRKRDEESRVREIDPSPEDADAVLALDEALGVPPPI